MKTFYVSSSGPRFDKTEVRATLTQADLTEDEIKKNSTISKAWGQFCKTALRELTIMAMKKNGEAQKSKEENMELLNLFSDADVIYFEEIECHDTVGSTLQPWLRVTTPIGHFVVGYYQQPMSRYIRIDWSDTVYDEDVYERFLDMALGHSNKGQKYILVDNMEDANYVINHIFMYIWDKDANHYLIKVDGVARNYTWEVLDKYGKRAFAFGPALSRSEGLKKARKVRHEMVQKMNEETK